MNNLPKELLESLEDAFGKVPYEHLENERQSLKTLEKLRQSFLARGNAKPAAYGSVYLDDDGVLTIGVVDGNSQLKKEIAEAIGNEKYYIVNVTYPWSYLETIGDAVSECMIQKPESPTMGNLVSVAADEKTNKVILEMLDISESAVQAFRRNIIDSPTLVFKKVESRPGLCATINAGSGVHIGSVAYRVASYIGQPAGFMASGHCYSSFGQTVKVGLDSVGIVANTMVYGSVDAAYVGLISGNSATNTIQGTSSSISTTTGSVVAGSYVYVRGAETAALKTGIISHACKAVTFLGGITHTDLIEADAGNGNTMSTNGDSGGLYCTVSGLNTLGVLVGSSSSSGGSKGWACKHTNISYEFSVYRY